MKTFRLIAVFAFAAIFAVTSTFAQAQTPATGAFRIAIINTSAFDNDKDGIKRYVTAMNTLETQLKPELTVLQTMGNRLQALQTEIEGYKKQLEDPKRPAAVDVTRLQATAQTKYDEYQKMGLEFEYKQKDYKASVERREATIMSPVRLDIGNAIQEFTKQKGYAMVLDAAKLDGAGLLLGFDPKYDITQEFIAFYNARTPGSTASAATPK